MKERQNFFDKNIIVFSLAAKLETSCLLERKRKNQHLQENMMCAKHTPSPIVKTTILNTKGSRRETQLLIYSTMILLEPSNDGIRSLTRVRSQRQLGSYA